MDFSGVSCLRFSALRCWGVAVILLIPKISRYIIPFALPDASKKFNLNMERVSFALAVYFHPAY